MQKPAVVIDNGTGFTKMGYAGNYEPSFITPSTIATAVEKKGFVRKDDIADLDFMIGNEAMTGAADYNVDYPIRHGLVENWDNMEKFWQRCIYQYMRCDPEEHYFLLTEPPLNTPENRENTAEIMFETFNVPGLYIAVQAVLALCASRIFSNGNMTDKAHLTGTVIDSGDGVTHVIPVVDGYVIGSCIKHIPLAGRDVTNFVLQQLRERGEVFPADDALSIAKKIKETYCYVSKDIVEEYQKFDADMKFPVYKGKNPRNGQEYSIDVGYESFLAPELFFNPEIYSSDFADPLSTVVDSTIQNCPIDTRRRLYEYITLSGGTTMFKDFSKRLKRDIKKIVQVRQSEIQKRHPTMPVKPIEVEVHSHPFQRYAVWFGGSLLASQSEYLGMFHTKAQYEEEGPRIARHNPVLQSV